MAFHGARPNAHELRITALLALAISAFVLTVLSLVVGRGPLQIDAADVALAALRDPGAGAPLLGAADIAGSLPVSRCSAECP